VNDVNEFVLEMRAITKVFPGVRALDNVSLKVKRNSVHALIGENGAGKSTLMKILSGQYSEYEGEILINGELIHFENERMALNAGIAIVSQELNLVPEMTVSENIFLGREILKKKGILSKSRQNAKTEELLADMNLNFHATDKISDLSIAQRQLVEIVKATSRDAKLVVMDEPTSALTDIEIECLFELIKKLKAQGITIIYISHKLDEIYTICDFASVLRDGKNIGDITLPNIDRSTLISMMVGRPVNDIYPPISKAQKEVILEVKDLYRKTEFEGISFKLYKGEILGISGMMGAGRSEVAKAIFGLTVPDAGTILLNGNPVVHKQTKDAIRNGIAMVTEDRASYGFVGMLSIRDNILLANCDQFSKNLVINRKASENVTVELVDKLSIKANNTSTLVGTLSGGNQQKVILAKWLARNIKILILDEPTRGIDVGAKQEIYRLIAALAKEGMGIIMISSELPEIIGLSHRTLIMADGKICGELSHEEITQEKIMDRIISKTDGGDCHEE